MKLTESEWQIMNVLWEKGSGTARDVADSLPEGITWAYTTIKTMLTRLESKKAVSEFKKGNTSVYTPLVTREQARKKALSSLLDQAFGGAIAPLLNFLVDNRKLSEKQKRQLADLLSEENGKKKGTEE